VVFVWACDTQGQHDLPASAPVYGRELIVGGLTNRVRRATLLTSGQRLRVTRRGAQTVVRGLPATSPDLVSVVKLELDGAPDHDISRVIGGADIFPELPA
jgi:hypothetical protein